MAKNIKNPKITVLMPVYNAENFLNESIDSILNQSFKDFEFLIINDASTDNSKKITMSYNDKRIRYFENSKNLGVALTLNKGLKLAKGKYIARMDADDIAYPQRLEVEYNEIITDDKIAIVASFYNVIDENGKYIFTVKDVSSAEEIYYFLQFRNCLGHPTIIFNKERIVNEFRGYDEKYEAEDNDLWLRVSKKYKIVKLNKALMKVRYSNQNKTTLCRKALNKSTIIIAQNNLQSLIGKPINADVVKILADHNPLSNSPEKIKNALAILEKVNLRILENFPQFLNKSVIKECCDSKNNTLRHYQLIIILFDSKFGLIFKSLYKVYRLTKYFFNKYQFN